LQVTIRVFIVVRTSSAFLASRKITFRKILRQSKFDGQSRERLCRQ
jgi:hypothetical protein